MNRLNPPVRIIEHSALSIVLLTLGFFFTCWLIIYLVTYPKNERKISREVLLASFSSIYLGIGSLFFMLSFGLNI